MPTYYCLECCQPTEHLNVKRAAERAGVTRATIYAWMKKALVHTVIHPSGRKFVCVGSLLTPGFVRYSGDRSVATPWQAGVGGMR